MIKRDGPPQPRIPVNSREIEEATRPKFDHIKCRVCGKTEGAFLRNTCIECVVKQLDRVERMEKALREVYSVGHNLDCLFCGFKDKRVRQALEGSGE